VRDTLIDAVQTLQRGGHSKEITKAEENAIMAQTDSAKDSEQAEQRVRDLKDTAYNKELRESKQKAEAAAKKAKAKAEAKAEAKAAAK
jgi:hypothetical protein